MVACPNCGLVSRRQKRGFVPRLLEFSLYFSGAAIPFAFEEKEVAVGQDLSWRVLIAVRVPGQVLAYMCLLQPTTKTVMGQEVRSPIE